MKTKVTGEVQGGVNGATAPEADSGGRPPPGSFLPDLGRWIGRGRLGLEDTPSGCILLKESLDFFVFQPAVLGARE